MLSFECRKKYNVFKRASQEIGKIRVATAKQEITEALMMTHVGQVLLELDHAKKQGLITDAEYKEVRSAGLNELRDAPAMGMDITTGRASEIENRIYEIALEKLAECECGPGQELKEIQLKIPIMISETVEKALEKSGYDVGTDAYYADPERFVSVIVRPTKELELRSGGRQW